MRSPWAVVPFDTSLTYRAFGFPRSLLNSSCFPQKMLQPCGPPPAKDDDDI